MKKQDVLQQIISGVMAIEVALIHKGKEFDSDKMIQRIEKTFDGLIKKVE